MEVVVALKKTESMSFSCYSNVADYTNYKNNRKKKNYENIQIENQQQQQNF